MRQIVMNNKTIILAIGEEISHEIPILKIGIGPIDKQVVGYLSICEDNKFHITDINDIELGCSYSISFKDILEKISRDDQINILKSVALATIIDWSINLQKKNNTDIIDFGTVYRIYIDKYFDTYIRKFIDYFLK